MAIGEALTETPKQDFPVTPSAVLVGGNWLLFIWAVHHMLEASSGYFINPLVTLLGMIFLANASVERQGWRGDFWRGVRCWCNWTFGSLPIIALGLCFSFMRFTARA